MDAGSWSPLGVFGPLGRTVADVALLLSVMAGPDASDPLSIADDGTRFRAPLERDVKGARVAWWKGLGGIPVEDDVRNVVESARPVFTDLGCIVEEDEPDFTGVADAFPVLRYTANHAQYKPLVRARPEWVKDTIRYEVEQAERLTAVDVSGALMRQAQMFEQSRRFFERYDFFVLPVTQLSPFDVTVPYPTRVAGVDMTSYIDWMRSCWYISFMSNPAMSVPAGFTSAGLPVGLQIVGRHRGEWELLQMAYAFEQATKHGQKRPSM
jgi:amidase